MTPKCSEVPRPSHRTESVGVIDHDPEPVFLLECGYLVEDSECSGHAEHSFGDQKHAAALCLSLGAGPCNHSFTVLDVVVTVFVFASDVQSDSVEKAGMVLCVIDYHVVTAHEGIDGGNYSLVSEVEFEGGFLLLESGETALKFLMKMSLACHHTASHRVGKSPACCSFSICLADFRVVCQTEIVVEAPAEHLLSVEFHVRT